MSALVVVCASRKPGPGRTERSAIRGLLTTAVEVCADVLGPTQLVDLRDLTLPHFDGRASIDYQCPDLDRLVESLSQASGVIWGMPGYWAGLAGPAKNLLDLLGGAHYDKPAAVTPISGTPSGVVSVGTDPTTSQRAAEQTTAALNALGSPVVTNPVVITNPRQANWDAERLLDELLALFCHVAALETGP